MAIKTSQGFKITSDEAIDSNLTLTKSEMKNVDESMIPDKYFTICQDDGKLYLYNKSNTVDATTGKFRVFEGGGGTGTISSGFGLTLNNNEISLTKCAVESVISNGYTKFYDKNDKGALFKPSENGMRYVYGDMGAETGEEIELVNKQYVDNKEPDAITNQEIDNIIFGE